MPNSNPFNQPVDSDHDPNDTDTGPLSTHHTLGTKGTQAARGDHKHSIFGRVTSEITDFNKATEPGLYAGNPGSANCPPTVDYWHVFVQAWNNTYTLVQIAIGTDNSEEWRRRRYYNGVWQPWYRVYPDYNVDHKSVFYHYVNNGDTSAFDWLTGKHPKMNKWATIPDVADAIPRQFDLCIYDASFFGLTASMIAQANSMWNNGINVFCLGNDTTSFTGLFTGVAALVGAKTTVKNPSSHPIVNAPNTWDNFTDGDNANYLTGVAADAFAVGVQINTNQPMILARTHSTNGARMVYSQPYFPSMPESIRRAIYRWLLGANY